MNTDLATSLQCVDCSSVSVYNSDVFCIQLFQLRLSDPTQAYATRPKGSVGSCKSDLG